MFVEIVNTEEVELWEGDLEKIPNVGDLFAIQYPKPDYYKFGYDDSTILMVREVFWNIGDNYRVTLILTDDWEYEEDDEEEDDEEEDDEEEDDEEVGSMEEDEEVEY